MDNWLPTADKIVESIRSLSAAGRCLPVEPDPFALSGPREQMRTLFPVTATTGNSRRRSRQRDHVTDIAADDAHGPVEPPSLGPNHDRQAALRTDDRETDAVHPKALWKLNGKR